MTPHVKMSESSNDALMRSVAKAVILQHGWASGGADVLRHFTEAFTDADIVYHLLMWANIVQLRNILPFVAAELEVAVSRFDVATLASTTASSSYWVLVSELQGLQYNLAHLTVEFVKRCMAQDCRIDVTQVAAITRAQRQLEELARCLNSCLPSDRQFPAIQNIMRHHRIVNCCQNALTALLMRHARE